MLGKLRQEKGLTQAQVAGMVGVCRSMYTHIENGRSRPSVEVALAIAHVLDSTVEELFGNSDQLPSKEADNAQPT